MPLVRPPRCAEGVVLALAIGLEQMPDGARSRAAYPLCRYFVPFATEHVLLAVESGMAGAGGSTAIQQPEAR